MALKLWKLWISRILRTLPQFREFRGPDSPEPRWHRPSEPTLAEIHRPTAPGDPRTLTMVQCATRHLEQKPAEVGNPLRF